MSARISLRGLCRLIRVDALRTCDFVGFLATRLKLNLHQLSILMTNDRANGSLWMAIVETLNHFDTDTRYKHLQT